ncbi:MAG: DUF2029 domain-containing protein [Bacteroidetes bacterium]|nr:DUF2029 domain-containing protein [Bacteroidota bacterium]
MSAKGLISHILDYRKLISAFLATLLFLAFLYYVHIPKNLLYSVLLVLLCFALYLGSKQKNNLLVLGVLGGVSLVVVLFQLWQAWSTFFVINEWDFLALYTYGKAGADGLAFYDPASFTHFMETIPVNMQLSQDFYDSVIKVGCDYPPTSMLLFAPLGSLEVHTALVVWRLFIILALLADIYLVYKIFDTHENRWFRLLIVVILVFVLPSTNMTLNLCQTNFFVLFFILLAYRDKDNWKAGMFLALAVVFKPVAAVVSLYFFVNRKWKPITSFILTGLALCLLSILFFGWSNFITFFTSPPTSRIPLTNYYAITFNQSLYAILYRLSLHDGMALLSQNLSMIVLFSSAVLTATACLGSVRLSRINSNAAFLIFLPLALLIYPLFWIHYAVILLPLLFEIISYKNKTALSYFLVIFLLVINSIFTACLLLLALLVFFSFRKQSVFGPIDIKFLHFR